MKYWLVILLFCTLSAHAADTQYMTQAEMNTKLQLAVVLPDTINSEDENPTTIIISIKNTTTETVRMSSPAVFENSVMIFNSPSNKIPQANQIFTREDKEHIEIPPKSLIRVKYDTKLETIFPLIMHKGETIEVLFAFYGSIKIGARTLVSKGLKSASKNIYIK
jgi:hypothetical protein